MTTMKRFAMTLLALLAAAPAGAQESTDAARLYKEGWTLFQQKQLAEACPLLERSLAAASSIRTRGALAMCYEADGRLASAFAAWRAVADEALAAGPGEAVRGRRAREKVEELGPRLARVQLEVAGDTPGLQVVLDGRAAELGVALPLDPGPHLVEATAAGRVDWQTRFDLGKVDEGTTRRVAVGPLAPVAPVAHVEAPRPLAPPILSAPEPRRRGSTLKWVGVGTAGVGVAALALGGAFALSARSSWSDARELGCADSGVCPTRRGAQLVDSAGTKATIATASFVTGAGLVAGGALLWALAPRSPAHVAVHPSGAALVLQGKF